jgi:hypothetical protein
MDKIFAWLRRICIETKLSWVEVIVTLGVQFFVVQNVG